MEPVKLEWMYKEKGIDHEEYLLGKAIDNKFEAETSTFNDVDKDILPTSIFANANSSIPVDVARKAKEDPLEQIKQKEIDVRKQLLKNPVKLKKLQNMLKAKAESELKRKKKKEKSREDIDTLLANKYKELLKKIGPKQLEELAKSDDSEDSDADRRKKKKQKKKKKHREQYSSDSYSSDTLEGDSSKRSSKKSSSSKNRDRRKSCPEPSSDQSKKTYKEDEHITHKRRNDSDDDQPSYKKHYGLVMPNGKPLPKISDSERARASSNSKPKVEPKDKYNRYQPRKKLTDKEKAERLQEMMKNAEWREKSREEKVTRYRQEEVKREIKDSERKEDSREFIRKHLSMATADASVEQRIKANINKIQRSSASMSQPFARR